MTGAAQVLEELTAHGLRVRIEGDRLALSPPSALTPELRERALAHKRELLTLLASGSGIQRCEQYSGSLAIREVSGLVAVLLPELPIPVTLVLEVPQLSMPVTIGTHRGCPSRVFTADDWIALTALAAGGSASPAAFRAWSLGRAREQLHGTAAAAHGCRVTVARVLADFGCRLRAVVLEGGGS